MSEPPADRQHPPTTPPSSDAVSGPPSMTGRQVYNVVSDTVTGINVRHKDNRLQEKAIAVCTLIGFVFGVFWWWNDVNGAFSGGLLFGFFGLLAGLFGSGIYLMIYRAVRHGMGDHD